MNVHFRGFHRAASFIAFLLVQMVLAGAAHAQFALCPTTGVSTYGLAALKLPQAWAKSCGTAYVAIIDNGIEVNHPSLSSQTGNVRSHLSKDCTRAAGSDPVNTVGCRVPGLVFQAEAQPGIWETYTANIDELTRPAQGGFPATRGHGTHVAGIVAATASSQFVGGCRACSLAIIKHRGNLFEAQKPLRSAVSAGAQIINVSGGTSPAETTLDQEIVELLKRDVLFVAASGNAEKGYVPVDVIEYPANKPGVIAIGGLRQDPGPLGVAFWPPQTFSWGTFGSASGPRQFLVAPARAVFSTFYSGSTWAPQHAADLPCEDQAFPGSTGFGFCSGTSMSAPYVSAIAGIVRSANPLLGVVEVRNILSSTATNPNNPPSGWDATYGYGIPDAEKAVTAALGGSAVLNRKTPLFALNSTGESNHVFTIVPQVAMAAIEGRLPPRPSDQDLDPAPSMNLYVPVGDPISGYASFTSSPCPPEYPGCVATQWGTPRASASVLTTPKNPVASGPELLPLYRMSWRCGDGQVNPPACATNPSHVRHFYTTSSSEMATMRSPANGYRLDGIEGFVYPAAQASLPANVVKLCRKYNSVRDDFILYAGAGTAATDCDLVPAAVAGAGSGSYGDFSGTHFVGYAYGPGPSEGLTGAPPPASIVVSSGSNQSATVGTPFAAPLSALVRDQSSAPVAGVNVTFAAPVTGPSSSPVSQNASTNAAGIASVNVSANASAGTYNVNAAVGGVAPTTFVLTNLPGAPAAVFLNGTPQSTATNAAFTAPLQVTVRDIFGNGVPNVTVTFAVPASGASATLSATAAVTNLSGVASVTATANGTAGVYSVTLSVSGVSAPPSFQLTNQGPATLAIFDGGTQSAIINTAFSLPLRVIVRDQGGNPLPGVSVGFAAPTSGAGAVLSAGSVVTNASGIAAITATANGTGGVYNVTASVTGIAGVSFALTNVVASLDVLDGAGQTAVVNTVFAQPLRVIVRDLAGNPLGGVSVNFAAPASGASAALSANSALTNASGVASVTATANGTGGGYNVTASANGIASVATFALANQALAATTLQILDGSGQSASLNTAFSQALRVIVKDQNGNPFAGASVGFAAPGSGASASLSASSAVTGANGIASVTATANGAEGSYNVTASVAGLSTVSFALTNQSFGFVNGSFELPATSYVGGMPTGWTGYTGTIANAYLSATNAGVAPEGGQVAYGGSFSQTLNLPAGFYVVTFNTRLQPYHTSAPISFRMNGVEQFNLPAGDSWVLSSVKIAAPASGLYTFEWAGVAFLLDDVKIAAAPAQTTFVNGSFELPVTSWVGGMPTGWTGYTGTAANAYLSAANAGPAPDGAQVAYGGSFSQTLSLPPGFYTVTFYTRRQPVYSSAQISFRVNGVEKVNLAADQSWVLSTVTIAAPTLGFYTFEWTGSGGFLIDKVTITPSSTPASFVNGSFELPATSWVGGMPTGWTGYTGTIANAYLSATNAGPAPEGGQVAYGGSFSQTLNLPAGFYTVTFNTRLQPYHTSAPISFRMNGVEQFNLPAGESWVLSSVKIAAPASGLYTFEWAGVAFLLDDVKIAAAPAQTTFVNGSFELPVTSWVGGMPTGWTGYTGTAANAYLSAANAGPAPDGAQVAYGGSFSQTLSLPPGFYTVTFYTRRQPVYSSAQISFRVNGVEKVNLAADQSWVLSTVTIAAPTLGFYTFEWTGSGGFLIDKVNITAN